MKYTHIVKKYLVLFYKFFYIAYDHKQVLWTLGTTLLDVN